MRQNQSFRICLDVDGVTADLIGGLLKHQKLTDVEPSSFTAYDQFDLFKQHDPAFDFMKTIYSEGFFGSLSKFPWSQMLYTMCQKYGRVVFLTAAMSYERECWLHQHFPGTTVIATSHKYELANPQSILIDDHVKYLDEFAAAGGHTIKFPQYWNTKQEHHDTMHDDIITKIENQLQQITQYDPYVSPV